MARLIDADALPVSKEYLVDEAGFGASFNVVHKSDIDNAPTVDAVEVVRCKDCINRDKKGVCEKFRQRYPFYPEDDFYCSYGERKVSE